MGTLGPVFKRDIPWSIPQGYDVDKDSSKILKNILMQTQTVQVVRVWLITTCILGSKFTKMHLLSSSFENVSGKAYP